MCMVYVHVYAGICTCVQAYTLVYVYEDTCLASPSIAFNLTPTLNLRLIISAELASKVLGSACLCSSTLGSQACVAIPCFLTWLLDFEFWSSCFHASTLTRWAICLDPVLCLVGYFCCSLKNNEDNGTHTLCYLTSKKKSAVLCSGVGWTVRTPSLVSDPKRSQCLYLSCFCFPSLSGNPI